AKLSQHRRNPPLLQDVVKHESSEEEENKDQQEERGVILKILGNLDERQKEQHSKNQKGRVVRVNDRENEEPKVADGDPKGDPWFICFLIESRGVLLPETRQFLAEVTKIGGSRKKYGESRLPAKVFQHEHCVPSPSMSHDQHGRCRERRQGPADGNVHEQKSQRSIGESAAWLKRV